MKNTRPHRPALFGMELCGVEIVAMERSTKGDDVVGRGYCPLAPGDIETVDKIDKLAALEILEQRTGRLLQVVPTHVGNLVGM